MKLSLKGFTGFSGFRMGAIDGEIGIIKEVYFDDQQWVVRYLIVKAGNWLNGRLTLISPQALLAPDWDNELFPTNLTIDQIRHGPDIDTDKPLYRQQEISLYQHFPWSIYWTLGAMPLEESLDMAIKDIETDNTPDPHLRSSDKVAEYRVFSQESEVGSVEDFILETNSWKIDFIVVKLGSWMSSKKVLLPVNWIASIDLATSRINLTRTMHQLQNCAEFDPDAPVNEAYEKVLRNYSGRRI